MSGTNSSFWRLRPVLITGGAGFVGGWVVSELLTRGAQIVCVSNQYDPHSRFMREQLNESCTTVAGDVRDQEMLSRLLRQHRIDTVFHLAAQAIVTVANRSPVPTFETNIAGTWSVLEACREARVQQIVVASSDKAYGAHDALPYREEMALQGRHPYDVSKSCADLLAQSYAVTYNLPVAITRCGNIYGGGDLNWSRIVPGTIRSVLRNERPVIRSDGMHVRDYLYVEDCVAAYLTLAEHVAQRAELRGGAFNFSTETPLTVIDLVHRILERMESDLEPEILDQANCEIVNQYLSAAKARQQLAWSPRWTLDDGLARAIAWYRATVRCGLE